MGLRREISKGAKSSTKKPSNSPATLGQHGATTEDEPTENDAISYLNAVDNGDGTYIVEFALYEVGAYYIEVSCK